MNDAETSENIGQGSILRFADGSPVRIPDPRNSKNTSQPQTTEYKINTRTGMRRPVSSGESQITPHITSSVAHGKAFQLAGRFFQVTKSANPAYEQEFPGSTYVNGITEDQFSALAAEGKTTKVTLVQPK